MDSKTIYVVTFNVKINYTEFRTNLTSFINLDDAIDLIDVLNGALEGDSELDYQLNDDQIDLINEVLNIVNYNDKNMSISNAIKSKNPVAEMKFEVETLTIFPTGSKLI